MAVKYILVGHDVVEEPDVIAWATRFESADPIVKTSNLDGILVRSVFLGFDRSFGREGPPLVFETMVFGGVRDGWRKRYSTWDQAVLGHDDWVKRLIAGTSLVALSGGN